uniref:Uncharacterized protein n=1 Tax=Tanacetum cinerariifolium TaxID=118510 RepID=A0A6L2KD70_TANCI|nr:hypothetical protein [Tanacetum cinerariifolium]
MKAKLALLEASPSSSQNPKTFQPKNKGLVAETFDWGEEEVSNEKSLRSRASESVNWLWHKRLSHLNFKNINKLAKQNKEVFASSLYELVWTSKSNVHNHEKYTLFIVDEYSRERITDISYFHVFGCLVFIHNHKDHLVKFDAKADDGYFLGYSFVSKAFRVFNIRSQQVAKTYHVILDESMEAIRQYQVDFDISFYIIPHGRSLTELTQENQVPEVIAPNKPDITHTEDTKGPPDLINTEGTHKKNVQNDQMITQPTDVPSRNNTEVSGSITESLVLDVNQSHILNQASTSSYLIPQDRWSRDQHVELVNIIGDPGEGMLTRSMAAKLRAVLDIECLFADFLSEIEPKKVFETLKHPGWVDAIQEELNQFYRTKYGLLFLSLKEKQP